MRGLINNDTLSYITLQKTMTNIIFDCDSTLCAIEGIDILADRKDIAEEIGKLTNQAMDGLVALDAVYEKRLQLIKPSYNDVMALSDDYIISLVTDARYVVEALTRTGVNVFIVSGGLLQPIVRLAQSLNIPEKNVFAVDLNYPQHQPEKMYLSVKETPLTTSEGKNEIVKTIKAKHPGRTIVIGDGASDAVTKDNVELFIGYGGIVKREKVAAIADVFFNQISLLPLLVFAEESNTSNSSSIKQLLIDDNRLQECQDYFEQIELKTPDHETHVSAFFAE